jgi:hypothetical protein
MMPGTDRIIHSSLKLFKFFNWENVFVILLNKINNGSFQFLLYLKSKGYARINRIMVGHMYMRGKLVKRKYISNIR